MQKYKIYTLSCPISHEIRYIGRTIDLLSSRLAKHVYERKKFKNHRCHWINSLYKKDLKPIILLLDSTDNKEDYFNLESYWIYQFKTWGFNLVNETYGGEGSLGYKHTNEAKERMKSIAIKRFENHKYVEKKICMTKNEQAKFISKKLSKSVIEYDISGNFIEEWQSITEASKFYDIYPTTISKSAKSDNIKANNSFWRYKQDYIPLKIDVKPKLGFRNPLLVYDIILNEFIVFNSSTAAFKYTGLKRSSLFKYLNKENIFKNHYKFTTYERQ